MHPAPLAPDIDSEICMVEHPSPIIIHLAEQLRFVPGAEPLIEVYRSNPSPDNAVIMAQVGCLLFISNKIQKTYQSDGDQARDIQTRFGTYDALPPKMSNFPNLTTEEVIELVYHCWYLETDDGKETSIPDWMTHISEGHLQAVVTVVKETFLRHDSTKDMVRQLNAQGGYTLPHMLVTRVLESHAVISQMKSIATKLTTFLQAQETQYTQLKNDAGWVDIKGKCQAFLDHPSLATHRNLQETLYRYLTRAQMLPEATRNKLYYIWLLRHIGAILTDHILRLGDSGSL